MNRRKITKIVLVIAVVLLLFRVSEVLAAHNMRVTVSPTSVGTGVTRWYWMSIKNGGGEDDDDDYEDDDDNGQGSLHAITKVVLELHSLWEAVDGDAPGGWTCTGYTFSNTYVWEADTPSDYIPPKDLRGGFDWKAIAPDTAGDYTMTVTSTDTNGETDTDTFKIVVRSVPEYPLGLAAVFAPSVFMYIFLKKKALKDG